eukprot:7497852-Pyramimonas_sp.AAC.1
MAAAAALRLGPVHQPKYVAHHKVSCRHCHQTVTLRCGLRYRVASRPRGDGAHGNRLRLLLRPPRDDRGGAYALLHLLLRFHATYGA